MKVMMGVLWDGIVYALQSFAFGFRKCVANRIQIQMVSVHHILENCEQVAMVSVALRKHTVYLGIR